jgi:cytochrome c553
MAAFLAAVIGTTSFAFHSGGVAECEGCHSMHSPAPGGVFLLVGTDPSSACLTCHEVTGDPGPNAHHISTPEAEMPPGWPPKQRTPGGDFGWLKKEYMFWVDDVMITENGDRHGHNIVAVDFGYFADGANLAAPGGAFPSTQLACTSCHDPHGKYRRLSSGAIQKSGAPTKASGSYEDTVKNEPDAGGAVGVYRLLAGGGYTKGNATFNGVPAAKAPGAYNRTEAAAQTRVAYGNATTGGHVSWGTWCGTCHGAIHFGGNFNHPVDGDLGSVIKTNYDQYVKTGDMTGTNASAFTSLVPFVENTRDYGILASHARSDDTHLAGPAITDRVSCLSCHRAHASGWEYALRWNNGSEFLTDNGRWPGTDVGSPPQIARGRTSVETEAAYYDRPAALFAQNQRPLCEKCHATP